MAAHHQFIYDSDFLFFYLAFLFSIRCIKYIFSHKKIIIKIYPLDWGYILIYDVIALHLI